MPHICPYIDLALLCGKNLQCRFLKWPLIWSAKVFPTFSLQKLESFHDFSPLRQEVCFWIHFPSGLYVWWHAGEHGLHRCHGSEGCCVQVLSGRVATLPVETPTNEPVHFPGRCSHFGGMSLFIYLQHSKEKVCFWGSWTIPKPLSNFVFEMTHERKDLVSDWTRAMSTCRFGQIGLPNTFALMKVLGTNWAVKQPTGK